MLSIRTAPRFIRFYEPEKAGDPAQGVVQPEILLRQCCTSHCRACSLLMQPSMQHCPTGLDEIHTCARAPKQPQRQCRTHNFTSQTIPLLQAAAAVPLTQPGASWAAAGPCCNATWPQTPHTHTTRRLGHHDTWRLAGLLARGVLGCCAVPPPSSGLSRNPVEVPQTAEMLGDQSAAP